MKKFLFCLLLMITSMLATAQNLPAGYIGVLPNGAGTNGYQTYTYTFTPNTSGAWYIGFAFRQDPAYWSFGAVSVTAAGSSTNLIQNGNMQYGGSTTVNNTNYQGQVTTPADWGVWYQNGTYPSAAGQWQCCGGPSGSNGGQWYDGAVGSYDGIYQAINVTAGVTYTVSFQALSTSGAENTSSIRLGTYAGQCNSGQSIFTCTPPSSSGFSSMSTPSDGQGVGGAPPPSPPPPSNGGGTTISGNGSSSGLSGIQFGASQVADTQWDTGSCLSSNSCTIYSTSPGITYESGSPTYIGSGQYIGFIQNTGSDSSRNPWTMILYNSDGTIAQTLGTGRIVVEGSDNTGRNYFFFTNDNYNGTLLSGNLGLSGQGVTFSGTQNPTISQTNSFSSNFSSTPLSAGQSGGGTNNTPTLVSSSTTNQTTTSSSTGTITGVNDTIHLPNIVVSGVNTSNYTYSVVGVTTPTITTTTVTPVTTNTYSDGSTTTTNGTPTSTQTTTYTYSITPATINNSMTNPYAGSTTNAVYINQTSGSYSNVLTASQYGQGNLIEMYVNGEGNNLNAAQGYTINSLGVPSQSTASNSNTVGITILGNNNTVTTQQIGNNNTTVASITGNSNPTTVVQTGNNNQSFNLINGGGNALTVSQTGNNNVSSINLYGASNVASVTQSGSAPMSSLLNLTNAGGANNVNVTQTGATSQSYILQQTCSNPAGCSVSIHQGN